MAKPSNVPREKSRDRGTGVKARHPETVPGPDDYRAPEWLCTLVDSIFREGEKTDAVDPPHYKKHPSGVECITISEHFNFCLGNAIKYIWRAGEKGNTLEDLKKARWYLDREIKRLELCARLRVEPVACEGKPPNGK